MRALTLLLLLTVFAGNPAAAHAPGSSRLLIRPADTGLQLLWEVSLQDAALAVGLDHDGDGTVTARETRQGEGALFAYAMSGVQLQADATRCVLRAQPPLQLATQREGRVLVVRLLAHCERPVQQLTLRTRWLHEQDPAHRTLVRAQLGANPQAGVLTAGRDTLHFASTPVLGGGFVAYGIEGVYHVLQGWDHLLFLAALFLPAVLQYQSGRWRPHSHWRRAMGSTALLISTFTLAHAATLSLTALGWLALPSRWVEAAVAASVLFAALGNFWPRWHRQRFGLVAVFGLIHGAAMATALLDLGLPGTGRVMALAGFNLGVEAAQLALVAALLPLCWRLREAALYRRALLPFGSALIALVGLIWLLERVFAVNLRLLA